MTTTTITPFAGFPGEGLEFLAGLAENNTREYFEEHRGTYESALLEPARRSSSRSATSCGSTSRRCCGPSRG
jgi:uncharacterized protein (DUF2461 family)